MTILLIGIGAVHCVVLLVLTTELVLERRHNAALADRNAVQAQELAMLREAERFHISGDPVKVAMPRPFGRDLREFEDRN